MTVVMKKFTTRYHENLNRTENRGFFLQNLPKPTDRKHFETVTTLLFWHCYHTIVSLVSVLCVYIITAAK